MSILELFGWKQPTNETAAPAATEATETTPEKEQFRVWLNRLSEAFKKAADQNQNKGEQ